MSTLPCRETSNQETEGDTNFQKSTGALISEKDRELETLRNEVLTHSLQYFGHCTLILCHVKHVRCLSGSICRSRCCEEKTRWPRPCSRPWRRWRGTKLSCRVVFTVWSKGSWEHRHQREETRSSHPLVRTHSALCLTGDNKLLVDLFPCWRCAGAGDAVLEQLREEKEFAEGQVRLVLLSELSSFCICSPRVGPASCKVMCL